MSTVAQWFRLGALGLLTLAAFPGASAQAQDYPAKPVKIVTQGAAGSGPDVIARILADHLGRLWAQQVVVLPHPGAAGSTAARVAAGAVADGYTLYMPATSAFVVMPEMLPNLPFDLGRDFVPIGFVGEQPMVIAVAPALGIKSLSELAAPRKERPGEILYAANNRGSLPHLTAERLRKETGADLTFIPYPGVAAGLQDLVGGRISLIVESVGPLYGAIQGGSIKPLAVASHKRLPNLPDLPTVAETVPGFAAMGWFPLMAPRGTPEAIIRKVNRDLETVLRQPELRQRFQDLGTFTRPMLSAEVTEFIRGEQQLWRPVVRQIGLGPQ
jgi:tripartite-type tricarboxylate transporter receptor subunit TctC